MIDNLLVYEVGFAGVAACSAAAAWRWTGAHLDADSPAHAPPVGAPPTTPPGLADPPATHGQPVDPPTHEPPRSLTAQHAPNDSEPAKPRAFAPEIPTSVVHGPWRLRWAPRGGDVQWVSNDEVGILLYSSDRSASDSVAGAEEWLDGLGNDPDGGAGPGGFADTVWPSGDLANRCGAAAFWSQGAWVLLQEHAALAQRDVAELAIGPAFANIESGVAFISTDDELFSTPERCRRFFAATQIPGPALRVLDQLESAEGAEPIIWITGMATKGQ